MNIAALAQTVYSAASAPIRTERSTENQVFAQITHRLSKASADSFEGFIDLASGVKENRRLGANLASDVSDDENGLPSDLRAQIFYLAEFTEVHSRKVLTREANSNALVEINTAIMRGLRATEGTSS